MPYTKNTKFFLLSTSSTQHIVVHTTTSCNERRQRERRQKTPKPTTNQTSSKSNPHSFQVKFTCIQFTHKYKHSRRRKKTRKYDSSFLRFHTSLILLFTLSYNSLSYGLLVVPPLYPVFSLFPTITLSSYSREKKLFSFHNATCPNTHNTYIYLSRDHSLLFSCKYIVPLMILTMILLFSPVHFSLCLSDSCTRCMHVCVLQQHLYLTIL